MLDNVSSLANATSVADITTAANGLSAATTTFETEVNNQVNAAEPTVSALLPSAGTQLQNASSTIRSRVSSAQKVINDTRDTFTEALQSAQNVSSQADPLINVLTMAKNVTDDVDTLTGQVEPILIQVGNVANTARPYVGPTVATLLLFFQIFGVLSFIIAGMFYLSMRCCGTRGCDFLRLRQQDKWLSSPLLQPGFDADAAFRASHARRSVSWWLAVTWGCSLANAVLLFLLTCLFLYMARIFQDGCTVVVAGSFVNTYTGFSLPFPPSYVHPLHFVKSPLPLFSSPYRLDFLLLSFPSSFRSLILSFSFSYSTSPLGCAFIALTTAAILFSDTSSPRRSLQMEGYSRAQQCDCRISRLQREHLHIGIWIVGDPLGGCDHAHQWVPRRTLRPSDHLPQPHAARSRYNAEPGERLQPHRPSSECALQCAVRGFNQGRYQRRTDVREPQREPVHPAIRHRPRSLGYRKCHTAL